MATPRDYRDYKKSKLSASDKGRGIKVSATASPGTLIHTATASSATNEWDAVTLRAVNTSTSAVKLTVEWGGTSNPDDHIELTIPAESGLVDVVVGHLLNDGATIRAFAATANVLMIHGYVDRYDYSRP